MSEKTITLRADLVERLERIASEQGRTVDDVVENFLPNHEYEKTENPPKRLNGWAFKLVEAMEAADIDWQEPPHGKPAVNFTKNIYMKSGYAYSNKAINPGTPPEQWHETLPVDPAPADDR
jgi:hypothetical protein